ncbi:MAG TPA: BlaI/MecI/CopY family transcriptional regulator [Gemmatimonadales bacterium]|jgi:predicted transcriptional regulator
MPGRPALSRRERQIMEIIYRRGAASAADVQAELPSAPSYSAVRALLRILEEKGHLKHEADGAKYVYRPIVARQKAGSQALDSLVDTFFGGSPGLAAAALLGDAASRLSNDELENLEALIQRARKEGR